MTVIAELSVLPVGTTSPSLGKYVAEVVKAPNQIKEIKFQVGPMASAIEAGTRKDFPSKKGSPWGCI